MKTYTEKESIGNVTFTRIAPLSPEIVRFALTARIPREHTVNESTLALYELLLLTGTIHFTKERLEEYLKENGIELAVSSGIRTITITGSVRRSKVSALTKLLSELLFSPRVLQNEFTLKRTLALEKNREEHDNARRIAHTAFMHALYPNEPRMLPQTLTKERNELMKITSEKVRAFEKILPECVWYLSVVGDRTVVPEFHRLSKLLARSATRNVFEPLVGEPSKGGALYSPVKGKTNIEVFLGNICDIRNDDPDFIPLDFGIDVLGKVGGFSGRLMSTVREKEGLTYGIYAHTANHQRGNRFHFVIRTFFMAKDYERGIASTRRELKKIVSEGITHGELTTFKEILQNGELLAHESNETRLNLYHGLTTLGYTEALRKTELERMRSLTVKEVNAALRANIDPESLVISAAGPVSKEGTPLIPH